MKEFILIFLIQFLIIVVFIFLMVKMLEFWDSKEPKRPKLEREPIEIKQMKERNKNDRYSD